jgi:hypothetical protein
MTADLVFFLIRFVRLDGFHLLTYDSKDINVAGSKYSSAPVSTGNTFQDLPRLRETVDNTESYIEPDFRVTYINTVKFNR